MSFNYRLHCFTRNLIAFILILLINPFYHMWKMITSTIGAFMTLTVTDGSELIMFPHEWDWNIFS